MIPANVDMGALSAQLDEGQVALQSDNEGLRQSLESSVSYAADHGFGSLGVAVLDQDPAVTADLRDIAQVLRSDTALDTVIVRSPGSGAIVSTTHSRAEIESAQWDFLANPDYAQATVGLVDHIEAKPVPGGELVALALVAIVLVVAATMVVVKRMQR
ncbi:DUF6676 family protein [Corynebacterium vitaeruminis]|uniref:Rv1476 family membrane protein n=1 Tax=Corynebacterium vitaeruminis TaxID=38305 RepID=UPI000558B0D4|nr:DUF6676 family protein [Corynebacterium vitaeruminis]